MTATPKELVQRLVEESINRQHLDRLDELCTPELAAQLRRDFSSFREAFPDRRSAGGRTPARDPAPPTSTSEAAP